MQAIQVIVQAPLEIRTRVAEIPAPGVGKVRVLNRLSAISPGTEMLFYRGEAPPEQPVDSALSVYGRALAYPLHYGYATVGVVDEVGAEGDKTWSGRRVFALQPHASAFLSEPHALFPIPDDIPDERAAMLASAETAVNLVQDAAPIVGERVLVLGLGVIGQLVTSIVARAPAVEVTAVDPLMLRLEMAEKLGASTILHPDDAKESRDFDLVFELTGRPESLSAAIAATGYGGRVVVGSWYGTKQAPVVFDTHFHRNRIRIVSSQVSTIAPELSGRWDKARRLDVAWRLLADDRLDALVTHRFPADRAAEAFQMVDKQPEDSIQVLLTYENCG